MSYGNEPPPWHGEAALIAWLTAETLAGRARAETRLARGDQPWADERAAAAELRLHRLRPPQLRIDGPGPGRLRRLVSRVTGR